MRENADGHVCGRQMASDANFRLQAQALMAAIIGFTPRIFNTLVKL